MAAKILQTVTLISILLPLTQSIQLKFPAVFNFGDSNSDTGNTVTGLGIFLPPTNGQTYFKTSSGRVCDGRLISDFLMNAMQLPFLNAYLRSMGMPDFRKGCNFAASGSTILPPNAVSVTVAPFSFGIQVQQFLNFKARTLEFLDHQFKQLDKKLAKNLPEEDYFGKALYMFDIGQNDLAYAFLSNRALDQVVASIPAIMAKFEAGIKILYDQGCRNFWIHNTGPLGCLAIYLKRFGTDPSKHDEMGCLRDHNQAAKLFNLQLLALTKKLQAQYPASNFTHVDIHTIKYNLIANYSQYGFAQPIMTCCGYGGPPLNFDFRIHCGETKVVNGTTITGTVCVNPSKYLNWDGTHYTEAANRFVSSQILSGKFSYYPA